MLFVVIKPHRKRCLHLACVLHVANALLKQVHYVRWITGAADFKYECELASCLVAVNLGFLTGNALQRRLLQRLQ